MSRTAPQLGGGNGTRQQSNRFPQFTGISPRVSARGIHAHRGEYISIIIQPTALNQQRGSLEARCVVTDEPVEILSLPTSAEVAQINEFICYVDPANGELEYSQHGTYNDEYDVDTYRKILELCPKFTDVF